MDAFERGAAKEPSSHPTECLGITEVADQNIEPLARDPARGGRGVPSLVKGLPQLAAVRIGKYQVEAETGNGTAVRVFSAFDHDTGRTVTLKVLANVSDRYVTERFRREVATIAKLHIPSVIGIYELGEHVGLPFAAMERLGDDDLGAAISDRRAFTLLEKMNIIWRVTGGVQAAHRGGLSYVGVRPSGIALGSDGRATLQDFGIVRLAPTQREQDSLYASPEESKPGSAPDPLCDIFALGIVSYELLTGAHPFGNGSASAAKSASAGPPPLPLRQLAPECPEELEFVISRALESQRELRYQSLEEFQEDAEPILGELKRTRAAILLKDVPRWMDAGEPDRAQAALREVLELDPENRTAQRLRTAVRDAVHRRSNEARVQALIAEADQESAAHNLRGALELLNAAARLDGSSSEVQARLEAVRARLERTEAAGQLIADARQALRQQDLMAAREKASDALRVDPQNTDAAEMMDLAGKAIEQREREARIEGDLAKAESLLLMESFDAAAAILTSLRAEYPDADAVAHWLVHVEAQKHKAERRAHIRERLGTAESLRDQGHFEEALAVVDTLKEESPDDQELSDLIAHNRQQFERGRAIAQILQESEWLLGQDRPDLASQLLREKCAEFPHDEALEDRLAAIEHTLSAWQGRRLLQGVLARVAALEQLQQWKVALTLLEETLRISPDSSELLEAVERVGNRLREEERHKRLVHRLEMIRQKVATKAWSQALALIESAQQEFPGEAELQDLLDRSRNGLRRSECETLVTDVRQCLADGEAEQAQEIFRSGLLRLGEDPTFREVAEELEADRLYQEQWRNAQVLFCRRQFQEAEEILVGLVDRKHPEVRSLLELVRDARAASEEDQFYSSGHERAIKLIEQQQFEEAADVIRNLLSLFPDDPILKRDLESAQRGCQHPEEPAIPSTGNEPPIGSLDPAAGEGTEPIDETPPSRWERLGSRLRVPVSVGWAAASMATVLLLISASATLWRYSLGGPAPQRPRATPASAKPSPVVEAPVEVPALPPPESAATEAPVRPMIKPGPDKPHPKALFEDPRRTFNVATLTNGGAQNAPPAVPPPPGIDPVASDPQIPALLASAINPVSAPAPSVNGVQSAAPRIVGDPGERPDLRVSELARGGRFQQPRPISTPAPEMPKLALQRGIYGLVTVEASVDKHGAVSEVLVRSGNPVLADAAKRVVLHWRYQPALLDGQPIEAKVEVRINFEAKR